MQDRRELANHNRPDRYFSARIINDHQADDQQGIAAQNGGRQPHGNAIEVAFVGKAEQDDTGDEEQLVSKRIQNPPQFAVLIVVAGEIAVDAIADRGHGEA